MFISPAGFIVYANDYLNAYDSYKPDKPFSPALYYLICRSLELSFKAFLLTEGIKRNKLRSRDYGHNLKALLKKTKELNIMSVVELSGNEQEQVSKANNWYMRKGFEYFEMQNIIDGKDTLPDLKVLRELAQRLVTVLKPICVKIA